MEKPNNAIDNPKIPSGSTADRPFEGRLPVPYKKGKFSNATYNCEIRRRSDPASREAKFILKRTPGTCVLKKSSCFQLLFNSIR